MIDLGDLRNRGAVERLKKYKGKNPYFLKLQNKLKKRGVINLTNKQSKYILDNYNLLPTPINKIIEISEYLGQQIKKDYNLDYLPKRVKIVEIIAEGEKYYHCNILLTKKQKTPIDYFIPKTQLMENPYDHSYDVEVDFDKYEKIDKMGRKIYEHQKEGVKFLLSKDRVILGDTMGLGKTMTTIVASLESKCERILVICPASLKVNWEREINAFEKDTQIINSIVWESGHKYTIINFDILKNFHPIGDNESMELLQANYDLIIVDEAHNLSDKDSNRSQIVTDLSKNKETKIWLLTGTPITNRPMNFFNPLKILNAPITENWVYFTRRYCEGKQITKKLKNGKRKKIWLTNGASNLEELAKKTKPILLRRLKEDVLDLPEKHVTPLLYEMNNDEWLDYNEIWENYLLERKKQKKRGKVQKELVEIILLRQFIAKIMVKRTVELVEKELEKGNKIVIFTSFTEEINELYDYFGDEIAVKHNGEMSEDDKQKSVDRFQSDKSCKIFIGNIVSAGVGITLTKGNVVIFNSFSWRPGDNEQCEDRTHRMGQDMEVWVYYQIFKDTIVERMWNTVNRKKEIINQILMEKGGEKKAFKIIEDSF